MLAVGSYCIPLVFPVIKGARIIAQTKIEITPDQPLDYHWEGHGFKVHIPAGAIGGQRRPVILCIQASLSGNYRLPNDSELVSGVYWLSLHPTVKRFHSKATISIQHCASDDDSALSFITAMCTQKTLPYDFKSLAGGSFSESANGNIQVDHFSAYGILSFGRNKLYANKLYAFCTYYIPKATNVYEAHITVTQDLDLQLKVTDTSVTCNKSHRPSPPFTHLVIPIGCKS